MIVFSADEVDTLSVRLDCCGGWSLSFESMGLRKIMLRMWMDLGVEYNSEHNGFDEMLRGE